MLSIDYERAALNVLENNEITPEWLGMLVYDATNPPFNFTQEEAEKSSYARHELFSLVGGRDLYWAKMRELRRIQ